VQHKLNRIQIASSCTLLLADADVYTLHTSCLDNKKPETTHGAAILHERVSFGALVISAKLILFTADRCCHCFSPAAVTAAAATAVTAAAATTAAVAAVAGEHRCSCCFTCHRPFYILSKTFATHSITAAATTAAVAARTAQSPAY
jgi:hypothetical protein